MGETLTLLLVVTIHLIPSFNSILYNWIADAIANTSFSEEIQKSRNMHLAYGLKRFTIKHLTDFCH